MRAVLKKWSMMNCLMNELETHLPKPLFPFYFILCGLVLLSCAPVWAASPPVPFSIAMYYAHHLPVDELKAFDVVVADPDSGASPSSFNNNHSEMFAYVSLGEVDPGRAATKGMDKKWFIGSNKTWKTDIVDTSNPEWRAYFIDKVVAPLWRAGYRGFFVDTLDSYRLAVQPGDFPRMEAGMVATLLELRQRFPGVKLILNRGFELVGRLKGEIFAVAAESLFQGHDPESGNYRQVPEKERQWLLARFQEVLEAGVPVIAIDYVSPDQRDLARSTAAKIKELGIIPWVTDKDLASLGIGAVEVMPRKILGLYDGAEGGGDPFFSNLQRFAAMPLNYLGYTLELHDLREPLPEGILAGRYAGVLVWPVSDQSGEQRGLKEWTMRRVKEGVPILFLDRFGFTPDSNASRILGLDLDETKRAVAPVKVLHRDGRIGFEQLPLPNSDTFIPLTLKQGTSLLRLQDAGKTVSDAAALTPWGGYILSPHVVTRLFNDQTAWVMDPFRLFKDALRLPDMPVPDTTTENGVRLLLSHVDGDGFASMAEWPGGGLAADELRRKILEKYRLPVTVSVITGVVAPNGLYPDKSPRLEQAARDIFALPWVEAASHSFSHPFRWKPDQGEAGSEVQTWHNLNIPGYVFNLDAEIGGSINYINERLMPPGKKARVFQWTGNCVPGEDAIRISYQDGCLNINGGDTTITNSNRSLTRVAPLGLSRNGWFQVFAPDQNENIYTDLWSDNFYGYRRVLETFSLTDAPRRLKPVDIYYHFYSATKEASMGALSQVYDWAVSSRLHSVFTSDYIEKVLDFNRTVVARDGTGWLVRNSGKLRELRIPVDGGYPDLETSRNVAGYLDYNASRYIHLVPGGEAVIRLTAAPGNIPCLSRANARLESLERTSHGMRLVFDSYTPYSVTLANALGCRVKGADGEPSPAGNGANGIELPEGKHALVVECR